mmetsp:Transcript_31576/g.122279  ORF Transcript_31576/g.122279 Transcript_31576/m.122279 type:complete len:250 (-) Transcript_31576:1174-1923(-)
MLALCIHGRFRMRFHKNLFLDFSLVNQDVENGILRNGNGVHDRVETVRSPGTLWNIVTSVELGLDDRLVTSLGHELAQNPLIVAVVNQVRRQCRTKAVLYCPCPLFFFHVHIRSYRSYGLLFELPFVKCLVNFALQFQYVPTPLGKAVALRLLVLLRLGSCAIFMDSTFLDFSIHPLHVIPNSVQLFYEFSQFGLHCFNICLRPSLLCLFFLEVLLDVVQGRVSLFVLGSCSAQIIFEFGRSSCRISNS